jgi:hypothetical protein
VDTTFTPFIPMAASVACVCEHGWYQLLHPLQSASGGGLSLGGSYAIGIRVQALNYLIKKRTVSSKPAQQV